MENWRPVVGYESLYSVSDKGNHFQNQLPIVMEGLESMTKRY